MTYREQFAELCKDMLAELDFHDVMGSRDGNEVYSANKQANHLQSRVETLQAEVGRLREQLEAADLVERYPGAPGYSIPLFAQIAEAFDAYQALKEPTK